MGNSSMPESNSPSAQGSDRLEFVVEPGGRLLGTLSVPGDKSISHRAVILASIADGTSDLTGFLEAEDTLASLAAMREMGVPIEGPHQGRVTIQGVGLRGLRSPHEALYLGNSGTAMRLFAGLLAGQSFATVLTGDSSLVRRPMRRVTDPLSVMGADISTSPHGTPPLTIRVTQQLTGCDYVMPVASAQVKSCLLLAGLYSVGRTCIKEPAPTRDHTERMLEGFGYPVQRGPERVCMEGGESLQGTSIKVPGDISSAAFFIIGACVAKGSNLRLKDVGVNPTRTGLLEILKRMGANVNVSNRREVGGEPVADIHVRSSRLRGIHVPPDLVPLAIDEFPALFVAAAFADGETVVTGAEELRVKESDRIASMAEGLQRLGVQAQATPGGMVIRGGRVEGGRVNSYGDHRVAMAFAMAAMSAQAPIRIDDCANVQTSFPDFVELSRTCGLQIRTTLDDT